MLAKIVSAVCIAYLTASLLAPEWAQLQADAAIAMLDPSAAPHVAAAAAYAAAIS
jgi:hypothetical protein